MLFLQMFSDVTFHLETISTNMTYTTKYIWLFMWKSQLKHSNVKSVENISRRNKNHKTCAKKALTFFGFVFGDFNISNIFYKIQNLNEWQLVSLITHWTYTFLNPWALDSPIPPQFSSLRLRHQQVTQNGMSLKMEFHSKWNVSQNWMSLRMECQSKWNVTKNKISFKMEYHSKWNITQNGMSIKMECHS